MIANLRINEISAKHGEGKGTGTGKIENVFKITSTEKKKDATLGDYVLVNFEFDVGYPGEIGNINFKGNLWYYHPELDKQITEEDKKIELNSFAVQEVSNAILQNCLVEAIGIARRLNLPSPIKLPQVTSATAVKYKKAKATAS